MVFSGDRRSLPAVLADGEESGVSGLPEQEEPELTWASTPHGETHSSRDKVTHAHTHAHIFYAHIYWTLAQRHTRAHSSCTRISTFWEETQHSLSCFQLKSFNEAGLALSKGLLALIIACFTCFLLPLGQVTLWLLKLLSNAHLWEHQVQTYSTPLFIERSHPLWQYISISLANVVLPLCLYFC